MTNFIYSLLMPIEEKIRFHEIAKFFGLTLSVQNN